MNEHRERLKQAVCHLIDVLFDIADARARTGPPEAKPPRRRRAAPMRPIVEDDIEVDDIAREHARRALLRRGKLVG
jgi:hypothetical protein